VKRAGCRTLLCLGVFGDALLFGFVVGVFCFFHHKQICMECIFVSIWKHLDFKTYVCIIIGDEYVPIRWILFFVIWDYVLFLKHSASEVKVCTFYGATWLEQRPNWVQLSTEASLGRYQAAEGFLRCFLSKKALPSSATVASSNWHLPATAAAAWQGIFA
jgi:hypothetical protein